MSVEMQGGAVDLGSVVGSDIDAADDVDAGASLVAFAEAMMGEDPEALVAARKELLGAVGPAGLVDAAAIVGNFQRMVRIADGTGIPLDPPVMALTADFRDELGLNDFATAEQSPEVGALGRVLGGAARPLVKWLAPVVARLMGGRTD